MFYVVPNYEFAQVSEDGQLRSTLTGSLCTPYTDRDGYLRCNVWNGEKLRGIYVHRAVALVFVENPYAKPIVNHKDSNRQNNEISNLEWVTPKENSEHGVLAGNFPVGEDAFHSKYTQEQIHLVCKLLTDNKSSMWISEQTGVEIGTVYSVKVRRTWLEISKDYTFPDIKAKITDEIAEKILYLIRKDFSVSEVVKLIDHPRVNRNTVSNIKNGKTFKHLRVTFNDQP